jgi:hypothetical protein
MSKKKSPSQLDAEIFATLREAYEAARAVAKTNRTPENLDAVVRA